MTVSCDNGTYVYPATKSGSRCSDPTNAPPMGAHFQLAMSDAEIDALDVDAWQKTILRALAHYGAYVGDTGGSWGFEQEAGVQYTSVGRSDPWIVFARANGWDRYRRRTWVGHLGQGVDWGRLRVLDPCVARGTC